MTDEKEERLKARKFMEFLMLQLAERKAPEKNSLSASSRSDEKWITVNGARVRIEEGQTKDQAVKEFLKGRERGSTSTGATRVKKMDAGTREKIKKISWDVPDRFSIAVRLDVKPGINAKYGNFELHESSGYVPDLTPIDVVLRSDDATIEESDLKKYEDILKDAIRQSPTLQREQKRLDEANRIIREQFDDTKTAYRGMGIGELESIASNDGMIGMHRRDNYAEKLDFVSVTVDEKAAADVFAPLKDGKLTVEFDCSDLDEGQAEPVNYAMRRDVRVYDRTRKSGERTYRPHEKFGGVYSGRYANEAEVHLRPRARPRIRSVSGADTDPDTERRVRDLIKTIEKNQGSPIDATFKRSESKSAATMDSFIRDDDDNLERQIKAMQAFHRGISRQQAIAQIRHWS